MDKDNTAMGGKRSDHHSPQNAQDTRPSARQHSDTGVGTGGRLVTRPADEDPSGRFRSGTSETLPAQASANIRTGTPTADPYAGASTLQCTREQIMILVEPVDGDLVEIRPDGIVYLPWIHFARRLTQAFGPGGWTLVPLSKPIVQDKVLCLHYAFYVQGCFCGEAVGEQRYQMGNFELTWASAVEACASDAITRFAKRLGMCADLWDPMWRATWMDKYATRVWIPDKRKFQWRRHDRPALPGEAKPGRGSESEYNRRQSLDRENQSHLDSINEEEGEFHDDSRG